MISLNAEQIRGIAERHFPNAPEKIVEHYGIEVRYSPLPFDGWCLQYEDRAVIRINSEISKARQRFTLAHELGHLILDIPTVVGESVFEVGNRKSAEEKKVDKIAAELLLPQSVVLNHIKEVPVTAAVIDKLARRAKVSNLMVALRVAVLSSSLGLESASVVYYENDKMAWQWSETLRLTEDTPQEVLAECVRSAPSPARIPHEGRIVVASLLENPLFNVKTVFLQLVPEAEGSRKLREEQLRELEAYVFQGDDAFRRSLNGHFGMFKGKASALSLSQALSQFNAKIRRDSGSLTPQHVRRLLSDRGQDYVRLRLQAWTKNE